MVSACVCFGDKGRLQFVDEKAKVDAAYYVGRLLPELISDCKHLLPAGFIFQQEPGAWNQRILLVSHKIVSVSIALTSLRRTNGPKLSRFEPDGLSRVGSYAGEIPQSATKAKTIRELKVALELIWRDSPLEPINKAIKSITKRLRKYVGTGGGQLENGQKMKSSVFI